MHNNPEVFEGTRADSLDPVHRAIRSGDVNLLKNLAAKGRSLRISDNLGYTPIHYAVRKFFFKESKYLKKSIIMHMLCISTNFHSQLSVSLWTRRMP